MVPVPGISAPRLYGKKMKERDPPKSRSFPLYIFTFAIGLHISKIINKIHILYK